MSECCTYLHLDFAKEKDPCDELENRVFSVDFSNIEILRLDRTGPFPFDGSERNGVFIFDATFSGCCELVINQNGETEIDVCVKQQGDPPPSQTDPCFDISSIISLDNNGREIIIYEYARYDETNDNWYLYFDYEHGTSSCPLIMNLTFYFKYDNCNNKQSSLIETDLSLDAPCGTKISESENMWIGTDFVAVGSSFNVPAADPNGSFIILEYDFKLIPDQIILVPEENVLLDTNSPQTNLNGCDSNENTVIPIIDMSNEERTDRFGVSNGKILSADDILSQYEPLYLYTNSKDITKDEFEYNNNRGWNGSNYIYGERNEHGMAYFKWDFPVDTKVRPYVRGLQYYAINEENCNENNTEHLNTVFEMIVHCPLPINIYDGRGPLELNLLDFKTEVESALPYYEFQVKGGEPPYTLRSINALAVDDLLYITCDPARKYAQTDSLGRSTKIVAKDALSTDPYNDDYTGSDLTNLNSSTSRISYYNPSLNAMDIIKIEGDPNINFFPKYGDSPNGVINYRNLFFLETNCPLYPFDDITTKANRFLETSQFQDQGFDYDNILDYKNICKYNTFVLRDKSSNVIPSNIKIGELINNGTPTTRFNDLYHSIDYVYMNDVAPSVKVNASSCFRNSIQPGFAISNYDPSLATNFKLSIEAVISSTQDNPDNHRCELRDVSGNIVSKIETAYYSDYTTLLNALPNYLNSSYNYMVTYNNTNNSSILPNLKDSSFSVSFGNDEINQRCSCGSYYEFKIEFEQNGKVYSSTRNSTFPCRDDIFNCRSEVNDSSISLRHEINNESELVNLKLSYDLFGSDVNTGFNYIVEYSKRISSGSTPMTQTEINSLGWQVLSSGNNTTSPNQNQIIIKNSGDFMDMAGSDGIDIRLTYDGTGVSDCLNYVQSSCIIRIRYASSTIDQ